ncbi:hypothetical protein E2K98_13955 [Bacillus salipaludis]|uniref:DUF5673 domain-containing protein n=1 Tax=Bacillus salipaludis TaxID=2547811 RepID=A0A4R5VR09_9BACI|nr:hypothetical protein [Bacillus salipaludis]MDQ6598627.1 hypothetical protein [Bacillus salipaludis]TDK60826.1 hypothetical protein E2K98_13955 [Bacillus salipaludis]
MVKYSKERFLKDKGKLRILTNFVFTVIFLLSVIYLIRYRLNLKKAAEISQDALYPLKESEFASLLVPVEWKEMTPLTKHTRSYQYVKWGTVFALLILVVILAIVITTEFLGSSFFSLAYLFYLIISLVRHQGNLYILPNGIIINGKYYSASQIHHYETEQIVRWHELYGYHSRVDNGFKLTFDIKKKTFQPDYMIVEDSSHLRQITDLLDQQGIKGVQKTEKN